jgi:hypothetical protein
MLYISAISARSDCQKLGYYGQFLCNIGWFLMRHQPPPSDEQNHRSDDLSRARLDQIIRSDHPLVRLANGMPWDSIVEQVADLLPPTPEGAGLASLRVRIGVPRI